MNKTINMAACISVGKNLIYKDENNYILEVYDKTIDGKDIYTTYGRFKDLDMAMSTAKRIERTKEKLK